MRAPCRATVSFRLKMPYYMIVFSATSRAIMILLKMIISIRPFTRLRYPVSATPRLTMPDDEPPNAWDFRGYEEALIF